LLTVNILVVNNIRDIETDKAAGRTNLAVRFGRGIAEWQYAINLVLGYAVPFLLVCGQMASFWALLPIISLPKGVEIWKTLRSGLSEQALNPQLGNTAKVLLAYCLLLALGLML